LKTARLQISVLVFLLSAICATAQKKYTLTIYGADTASAATIQGINLKTEFPDRIECGAYAMALPAMLHTKGYISASVDSLHFDSASARMVLFTGQRYEWGGISISGIDEQVLNNIGWRDNSFSKGPINFEAVQKWQQAILDYYENNGHPFAKTRLDSIRLQEDKIFALLKAEKGPLYTIDSLRNFGNAKISNRFLQQYLEIPNGTIYSKEKLVQIQKKIKELTYLEQEKAAQVTMLGTGCVLDLFLKQRKSSQINLLVGFLPRQEGDPTTSKKLLITGDANILLKNMLGSGETFGLTWQQIQQNSPRLNFLYNHPFLFRTPIGLDFSFDMFKRDTNFLNINLQFGVQYALNANQSGKVFLQQFQTVVSQGGINLALLQQSRRLPDIADVRSTNIGVDYEFNNTDYRLNPRRGNELRLITSIGAKKIKKNDQVTGYKDPNDPGFNFESLYDTLKLSTYQFRTRLYAAKYLPLANKRSTVKTAINAGLFQSGNIFRNELFQIGGYKLLRGFDEESQYLSAFAVATAEFRYLVGQNSFFYVLADGGWGRDGSVTSKPNYTYFGTGLGLAFETRAGIFNLAWAIGKRNDYELNLRQSKIHFGFVNYF
jgi:outer membrane protein assembly factor BamA